MKSIDQLNREFGRGQSLRFELGEGGLTRVVVSTAQAEAHVYLLGAHVSHWKPAGEQPVLFMSGRSWFEIGKPIRGGVPVCYPWFGPHPQQPDWPNHAFVRLHVWQVESTMVNDEGEANITLKFASQAQTRSYFPHDFELRHIITVGRNLRMTLQTRNVGGDQFTVTEALHTYLSVSDARQVSVSGLKGVKYLSKSEGGNVKPQADELIRFTGETDRVYMDTQASCVLHDPRLGRRIHVEKLGSSSTVVWNPWINKAAAMPDFGDDEWPGMVCIETANALHNAVTIAPQQTHNMTALLRVER